jgi:hypothetical protein
MLCFCLFYHAVYTQCSVVFKHGGTIMKDNKISCSYLSEVILNPKVLKYPIFQQEL